MILQKSEKLVLKQPYSITFGKYKLNIHEQRIILMIVRALQPEINSSILALQGKDVAREQPHNTPSKNYNVRTTLFQDKVIQIATKYLLPPNSKNYSKVKQALKSLRQKTITLKSSSENGGYEAYTGFILQAKYYNNNQFVEIQISKDLLPSFLIMSQGFTKYLFSTAFSLSSSMAIRIYQQISHWKNEGQMRVYLDRYRDYLGLGNKYPNSAQFKQSVLLPVQRELQSKADVWFTIKSEIKEGKKTIGWVLAIHKKQEERLSNVLMGASSNIYAKGDLRNRLLETLLKEFKLSKHQATCILAKVPARDINKTLHAIRLVRGGPTGIKSIGGYTYSAFSQRYGKEIYIS